ncbi:hypothetical protein OAQ76_00250 [bacterium]|nr:hypothetical protein [bacterium]
MSGANALTAKSKQPGTFTAELQLNYSPDGVYLDGLCYAIIINDPNYCAMSLTASEPYSSAHTTQFETTGLIQMTQPNRLLDKSSHYGHRFTIVTARGFVPGSQHLPCLINTLSEFDSRTWLAGERQVNDKTPTNRCTPGRRNAGGAAKRNTH